MRFRLAAAAIALAGLGLAAAPAHAAGFGEAQNFDPVAEFTITEEAKSEGMVPEAWENGATLTWRSTTWWFIGGVWTKSQGWAVRVPGRNDYWPISDAEIHGYQFTGVLPPTIRPGGVQLTTWLMGHSLWFLLGLIAVILGGGWRMAKLKEEREAVIAAGRIPGPHLGVDFVGLFRKLTGKK
jgi:hypothetical protein